MTWRAALTLLVLAAALPLVSCQKDEGPTAVVFTRALEQFPLFIQVADPATATTSLLARPEPAVPGSGVVAIFATEEKRPLSSAGARWHVDLIYLSPLRVIVDLGPNEPKKVREPVLARAPWSIVLVTDAGFIARSGVAIGDKVDLRSVPGA